MSNNLEQSQTEIRPSIEKILLFVPSGGAFIPFIPVLSWRIDIDPRSSYLAESCFEKLFFSEFGSPLWTGKILTLIRVKSRLWQNLIPTQLIAFSMDTLNIAQWNSWFKRRTFWRGAARRLCCTFGLSKTESLSKSNLCRASTLRCSQNSAQLLRENFFWNS